MRSRICLTLLMLAFATQALRAQTDASQPVQAPPHLIQFQETSHDFGEAEQGAPTETVFKFKNISTVPVKLSNVKASCGCTTPDWSKDEIAPGASGEIKVSYNSQRIGPFNKSIAVNYNDRADPITIFISGKINTPPSQNITEQNIQPAVPAKPLPNSIPVVNYSVIRGGLAFEKVIENLKSLTSEETVEAEFKFKNTTSMPMKILKEKTESAPEITVIFKDEVLKPNQETTVKVRLNGQLMKSGGQVDGYFARDIAFFTDEVELSKKVLTVNGNFKRVFTEAERNNSPTIVFDGTSVEGGKIIEGENYVYDFTFKNTGRAPLTIISAKPSCGCTAIKPIVESIAPGESGAITVTFNSKGRVGMQSKTVTVTSNDIENPTIGLRFTVEVVKDPFHANGVGEQQ